MAKSKTKRRRRPQPTISLAVIGGFGPLAASLKRGWDNETWRGMMKEGVYALTGVDIDNEPHFQPSFMIHGTIPIIGGILVHKVFNRLGVNRSLARMGVPYLRI